MKNLDRIIWTTVALAIGAVAVQAALSALVIAAIVGTSCFAIVRLVVFYTRRW